MPPRMRTRSAGRPAAESLEGGTGERGNGLGMGANEGVEGANGNVGEPMGVHPTSQRSLPSNCETSYPPCWPRLVTKGMLEIRMEYDGKGGAVALTRWIEKMESVHDISGCSINQKVKYTAGSFMKFYPSHEIQKLESELWNHTMVGAGHATYTDRFHELARLVPHMVTPESRMIEKYVYGIAPSICRMVEATEPKSMQKGVQISGALTDEAVRNGKIKNVKKRGNVGEPSKDRNGRDDNKRTRTVNAFDTT
ncbi:hypothetical protein Tco_0329302, partial [Tanacetum coccineum]